MNTKQHIPNKFQSLIESPDARPYSASERRQKSVQLSNVGFARLLDEAVAAAQAHVESRIQSIEKRMPVGTPAELTVEALFDSHFRKQWNFGPSRENVRIKVDIAIREGRPIELVALMFTRKNVCALKRAGSDTSTPDFAEVLSLVHLNSFAELVRRFHPHGCTFNILSEGTRFLDAFDLCEADVRLYQARLREWIERLGLRNITLKDYEDFLKEKSGDNMLQRRGDAYDAALSLYRDTMKPIFDTANMRSTLERAATADPVTDSRNARNNFVPLWDSIKHSLPYPQLNEAATNMGLEYEALYRDVFNHLLDQHSDPRMEKLRQYVLARSWNAAIEHNARILGDVNAGIDVASLTSDSAFRTTINPKPDSAQLGIYSVRETTSRVQPWHGTALVRIDGAGTLRTTVLSKLEIESIGAIPVCLESHEGPFFYATSDAVPRILSGEFAINMSTR